MMEENLLIFQVHSLTWHSKLWRVRVLQFFDMSHHFRDMTENNLSIFQVHTWHGKLGGYAFYCFLIKASIADI